MKKVFMLLAIVALFAACQKEEVVNNDNMTLKKGNSLVQLLDLNGPHFELNLVGKKDGWNDKTVDNPDRHTIFVPRFTEGWTIPLQTPNNLGKDELDGVRIDITQGSEFAVIDGSVFDEGFPNGRAAFQLASGKYKVVIAMRGKKNVASNPYIAGWLEAYSIEEQLWYYQLIGDITVTRKWQDITGLFMLCPDELTGLPWNTAWGTECQWIFDYMDWLDDQTYIDPVTGLPVDAYSNLAYFWQLMNNGSQLIKVRFYPV